MTIQRTLLERLRSPGPTGQRQLHVSVAEVQNSILANLQLLLNTCRGNSLVDPEYGLPHLSSIRSSMPDSVRGYESAIRVAIERHEPRLKNVRVRHKPHRDDGLELRFEISGLVIDESERTAVRFETYADEDGRLVVR
jgi:type VI secretion system lysozyme-like protein